MPAVVTPKVTPSGTGIVFRFSDSATARDSRVSNVVSGDASQTVRFAGFPTGNHFALTFGGQTTSSIPVTATAPIVYHQWTKSGLASGSYDVAINLPLNNLSSSATPRLNLDVFDGTTYLATVVLDSAGSGVLGGPSNPASFPDATLVTRGPGGTGTGTPIQWTPVGRYACGTGSLSVRASCATDTDQHDWLYLDCARFVSAAGGPASVVPALTSPDTFAPIAAAWGTGGDGQVYPAPGPGMIAHRGSGAGFRPVADPAAVRTALEALSTIGAGNVTVGGDGDPTTPMVVTLTGALGGVAQPLLTCTDGNVSIAALATGGILPILKINGGSPIRLPYSWLYYTPTAGSMPTAEFFFPQSPPAATYSVPKTYDHTLSGSWDPAINLAPGQVGRNQTGFSGQTQISAASSAPYATYLYGPFPAGQYRLSATWPTDAGFSTDVVYTISRRLGGNLATVHTDQTAAPSGAADHGVPWRVLGTFTLTGFQDGFVVTQTNGTSLPMAADAIRLERLSDDTSIRILDGDTVTVSYGAGWATCDAGAAPAATDQAVQNLAGGTLYPPLPTTATMKIGWNLTQVNPQSSYFYHSNLARVVNGFFAPAENSDGYPTLISASYIQTAVNGSLPTRGADGKTWPALPAADYAIMWDWPDGYDNGHPGSDAGLSSPSNDAFQLTDQAIYPGLSGKNHRRVFRFPASPFRYGVDLNVAVFGSSAAGDGTYHAAIENLRIYPASLDPTSPPKYRPEFLSIMAGTRSTRHLDTCGAVIGNATDFGDYNPPQSRITRNNSVRVVRNTISRIEAYTGNELDFDLSQGTPFLYTVTGSSHGMSMGQLFIMNNYSGPAATLASGTFDFAFSIGYVYTLTGQPNKFVAFQGPHGGGAMQNVINNPGGYVEMRAGTGFPLQDMVEISNLVGSDLYLTISHTTTDACAGQVATYCADHLDDGLKLRIEFSNETWNFGTSLYNWISNGSKVFYGYGANDHVPYTCERAYHYWTIMRAAWVAGGRDASDFIRVMASKFVEPGYTGRIATYCDVHSPRIDFDEFSGACYLENLPSFTANGIPQGGFAPIVDILTPDQVVDMWEIHHTYGGYENEVPAHLAHLAAHGYEGVPFNMYEGGPDHPMVYGGNYPFPNWGYRQHAVVRHPRYYGILLHILRVKQDSGVVAFHTYQLSGNDRTEDDGWEITAWAAYQGSDQLPYVPGDDAQDAIQTSTPDRVDLIRSITGGAVKAFAALYNATPSEPTQLAAGTVSGSATSPTAASLTSTSPTGGTSPYTRQWQRDGVDVTGATSAGLSVTGLTPGSTHTFRVRYTDSDSPPATVVSNTLSITQPTVTPSSPGTASLRRLRGMPG
jgi:hypothetical protein